MNAINKLRNRLNALGIQYENDDDLNPFCVIERIKLPSIECCRISIIQGEYTYGGRQNLLEVWDFEEEEPHGYMTIDEALKAIKNVL